MRRFPTYKGQRDYPGLLWSATTRMLIGYDRLLERDRLWLAPFDVGVRIASHPSDGLMPGGRLPTLA